MKFVWAGIILATLSIPAHAEWFNWATTTGGTVWYLDPERMDASSGKVKLWIKQDHSRDASVKARSSMVQVSINCRDYKFLTTARIAYDSYGKVMFSNNYSDNGYNYEAIFPDTMIDGVAGIVCKFDVVNQ